MCHHKISKIALFISKNDINRNDQDCSGLGNACKFTEFQNFALKSFL